MPPTREETIKASVVDKKITRLCHVTNLANLDSIIQVGLLSRSALESSRRPFIFNEHVQMGIVMLYAFQLCIQITQFFIYFGIRILVLNGVWYLYLRKYCGRKIAHSVIQMPQVMRFASVVLDLRKVQKCLRKCLKRNIVIPWLITN